MMTSRDRHVVITDCGENKMGDVLGVTSSYNIPQKVVKWFKIQKQATQTQTHGGDLVNLRIFVRKEYFLLKNQPVTQ